MTLRTDYDYRTWEQPEAVELVSARRGVAGTRQRVTAAKRRAVRSAEKSPSGGAYLGYEVNWHLPAALLTPGTTVRPGDLVEDGAGVRWTVLTALLGSLGSRWQLGCVDLALAFDLRDAIDVERHGPGQDEAGAAVEAWPSGDGPRGGEVLARGLACRVQPVAQEARDERGLRGPATRYEVTLERDVALTTDDRLRWGDVYLEIRGYRQAQRIDQLPVVDAEDVP